MANFVIVGHGLAGAVLAHLLIARGQRVVVLDSGLQYAASTISVGLVNPLIGPKLNPPSKINECLVENKSFFSGCEKAWSTSFYNPLTLHRIFISEEQKLLWREISKDNKSKRFLGDIFERDYYKKFQVDAPLGAGITKDAWQLDVLLFLRASKEALSRTDSLQTTFFNECTWKDSQKIIFCEGFRVIENPWFKYLPFAPAKGEVLTVESDFQKALNNGSWCLPNNMGQSFLGSTWDHKNLLLGPTEDGKKEILKKCNFYDFSKLSIIEHKSGVRSGTRDRNPIMGVHQDKKNYFLFNGFGSRGTTTIPYYAKKMVDFLLKNHPLPQEVNLNRFLKANHS